MSEINTQLPDMSKDTYKQYNSKGKRPTRNELYDHYDGIPDQQIAPGYRVDTFGYKYVTVLSLWDGSHKLKCCYDCFFLGEYGHCRHI